MRALCEMRAPLPRGALPPRAHGVPRDALAVLKAATKAAQAPHGSILLCLSRHGRRCDSSLQPLPSRCAGSPALSLRCSAHAACEQAAEQKGRPQQSQRRKVGAPQRETEQESISGMLSMVR